MTVPLFAVVHIGKTAGTTLNDILGEHFGLGFSVVSKFQKAPDKHGLYPFDHVDLKSTERILGKLQCVSGHSVMPWGVLGQSGRDIKYLTFLREPTSRVISAYQYNYPTKFSSFERWASYDFHQNQQCFYLCGEQNADRAIEAVVEKNIFVGITEHFDDSLALLRRELLPDLDTSYSFRNRASSRDIEIELKGNNEMLEIIKANNVEDQKLFEYFVNDFRGRKAEFDKNSECFDNARIVKKKKVQYFMSRARKKFILDNAIGLTQKNRNE